MPGFQVPGDLALNENATDLLLATGEIRILQELRTLPLVFRRTWRYDQNKGIPYEDDIMVKAPDLNTIRAIFQDAFLEVDGVIGVFYIRLELNSITRNLDMAYSLLIEGGSTLTGTFAFDVVGA